MIGALLLSLGLEAEDAAWVHPSYFVNGTYVRWVCNRYRYVFLIALSSDIDALNQQLPS